MKLIDGWRRSLRLWSVRLSAFGSVVFGALLAFPDQALAVWNSLPADIQEMVPNRTELAAGLFVAAAIARVLRQREAAHGQ